MSSAFGGTIYQFTCLVVHEHEAIGIVQTGNVFSKHYLLNYLYLFPLYSTRNNYYRRQNEFVQVFKDGIIPHTEDDILWLDEIVDFTLATFLHNEDDFYPDNADTFAIYKDAYWTVWDEDAGENVWTYGDDLSHLSNASTHK